MPKKGYRKPEAEARTLRVHTSLTPSEKRHLDQCVDASHVTGRSDYIRLLILGKDVPKRTSASKAKLIDELARLNRKLASLDNNINQIAKTRNTGLPVSQIHFDEALNDHRKLKYWAAEVLKKVVTKS
tara:strand:- start:238 stop:621 length:384 start_codon:yes stop_codon:yes gene_type:complete